MAIYFVSCIRLSPHFNDERSKGNRVVQLGATPGTVEDTAGGTISAAARTPTPRPKFPRLTTTSTDPGQHMEFYSRVDSWSGKCDSGDCSLC